jgi:hypothetical protein
VNRASSPSSLAVMAKACLKALCNECAAGQYKAYFKPYEEIWFYSVDAAGARPVEREIFLEAGRHWMPTEALVFCEILPGE